MTQPDIPSISAKLRAAEFRIEALSNEDRKFLEEAVLLDSAKADLAARVAISRVDPKKEAAEYLSSFSDRPQTARTYRAALETLLTWCDTNRISPLSMNRHLAAEYISFIAKSGVSGATASKQIWAASSFLSWECRRHGWFRNPFLRNWEKPPIEPVRLLRIPTDPEILRILEACAPIDAAAVAVLAYRGLRAGALSSLTIRSGRFRAKSKGRPISGEISSEVLGWITRAGLDLAAPFMGLSGPIVSHRLADQLAKLFRHGVIDAAYSAHDLRHAFAVREYRRDPDINRVRDLLGHSSVRTTQRYLRALKILE